MADTVFAVLDLIERTVHALLVAEATRRLLGSGWYVVLVLVHQIILGTGADHGACESARLVTDRHSVKLLAAAYHRSSTGGSISSFEREEGGGSLGLNGLASF